MTTIQKSITASMLLVGALFVPTAASAQSPVTQSPGTQSPDGPAAAQAPRPMGSTSFDQDLPNTPVRPQSAMSSLRTPIHTAPDDMGQAYGIWAAGDDYKVSFHNGMTFVPYLGKDYPHNQPLSWRTTSARLGTTQLIESSVPPVHAQQDYRYEYRFGAVTEAYDVRTEGLEQTFVLNQRPAAGDLVITGVVDSLMRSRNVPAAQQALEFADTDGHTLVRYGRAMAFDAAGNQAPVTTAHQDGTITLTLSGAWLAQAALPVTVDPLLTRVQVASWGAATFGTINDVDIARDDLATTLNMMFTYTRNASATDADAWARLTNEDYSGTTQVFTDITTTWDTDDTSCCFVGGASKWVIVMRRYFPNNATRVSQIRCHAHASGDTTLQTNYGSITPPTGSNDWRPDVGGVDAFQTGSNALVVFQREDNSANTNHWSNSAESTIHGSLIDATTANGTFGASFLVYGPAGNDSERPSVNQVAEGGANFSWVCVLQVYNNSIASDDWDIIGKRIGNTGTVSTGSFISDFAAAGTDHQLGPVVEGAAGRYAVFFATTDVATTAFKTGLIAGKSLHVERFDWAHGATNDSGNQAPRHIRSNVDRRWESTGIAYDTNDDSHWALGYRAVTPGVPVAYSSRVGYGGSLTEGPSIILYSVASQTPTAVACVFNNDTNEFMCGYGVDDGTTTLPVFGHTYTYDAPVLWSTSGSSCSTATLHWNGNQQIGSEFSGPAVTGASAAAAHFLLVSFASTNTLVVNAAVFPGCRLLVEGSGPNYLGTMVFQIGSSANWTLSLPEWLSPTTFYFQDWIFDNGFAYSTERLVVPVVK